jgi:hypothetical protein
MGGDLFVERFEMVGDLSANLSPQFLNGGRQASQRFHDRIGKPLHLLKNAFGLAGDQPGDCAMQRLPAGNLGRLGYPGSVEWQPRRGSFEGTGEVRVLLLRPVSHNPLEVEGEILFQAGRIGSRAAANLNAVAEFAYEIVDVWARRRLSSHKPIVAGKGSSPS